MEKTPEEKAELLMEMAEAPATRLEAELAFRFLHPHLESDIKRVGELNVLDVGSGLGEVALRFAALGHKVTMLEPQACLLQTAEERAREQLPDRTGLMRFLNERIENLEECMNDEFDLIICHETIEYVDDPLRAFNVITRVLKPRGKLSLLFRNRYGLIAHKIIVEEDVAAAMQTFEVDEFATELHHGRGRLYSDAEIRSLLEPLGYDIEGQYGLLVFSEFIDCSLFDEGECFKGMLSLEERAGQEPHLKGIGKFVQLICSKS
ncbi:MAG: methyltransferase domain-containing protein [Actinomycetota bacterium]|nr:methyltransferase domain-containing protein [Actinomycetota bacterium]MDD5667610.1 methyltransferase domain-containing protein [Actinomycetota bacterium]